MSTDMAATHALLTQIRALILSTRERISRSVDIAHVLTCFEIGRRIVAHQQSGQARAEYGQETVKEVAQQLTTEFGRGFSVSNLEYMRKFYLYYGNRLPSKP